MRYYRSMQDLIGNTPLVEIRHFNLPQHTRIFAKAEFMNPGGSVKDRVGRSMILEAEKSGLLVPGGTIVEATAGNTGIGIAFAALNRGYKVIFVVPEKFSMEKQVLMRALGADIVHTSRAGGMLAAEKRANEIKDSLPHAIVLGQFRNPANPAAHYQTTGPEIYRDLDGRISSFIMGAGSGGTYSGIMRYLKEKNPDIKGILADPVGSTLGGGEHGDYDIEGIGNDFVADTMDMSLVDEVIKVTDVEAFRATRMLAAREGILAGSSSGAAMAAAWKAVEHGASGNIVILLPDRGERYFSKHLYEEE